MFFLVISYTRRKLSLAQPLCGQIANEVYMRKKRKPYWLLLLFAAFVLCMVWFGNWEESGKEIPDTTTSSSCYYENAWIVSAGNGSILFMAEGRLHQYEAEGVSELRDVLADVETEGTRVKRIGVKEDKIRGKVLAVGRDFIEIEGYGRLPMADTFAVYKIYGELEQKDYTSILVGYDAQEFIVGEGRVCGAVMMEETQAANIRVLIMGDSYQGDSHERIAITSEEKFTVTSGQTLRSCEPLEEVVLTPDSQEFGAGRIIFATESGEGKFTVTSLERAQGAPSYYGNLEIWKEEGKLYMVNELSLEKYLYTVVPSEMPASYGVEALKAQAVCARSYAYRQILANGLSSMGAHVNDSSSYQVYNNYAEAEASNQAVEETKGQIMTYGGEVIQAYYFSTSCGYTTGADIWGEGAGLPYIQGKHVWQEAQESEFAEMITDLEYPSYDMEFPWYRWHITFSPEEIENCLSNKGMAEQVGRVTGMEVTRRGDGGVAKELTITGEKGSAVIEKEYAIRTMLSPNGVALYRGDGEVLNSFAILPSGFFIIREIIEEGAVAGYRLDGGGYGHGAGMSQNAVKAMTEQGMTYLDVLKFFYTGIEIENINTVRP